MRKYIQIICIMLLILGCFSSCEYNHDLSQDDELSNNDIVPTETQTSSDTVSSFVDMLKENEEEPETMKDNDLPKDDELPNNNIVPTETGIPFVSIDADWPVYKTAEELVGAATNVYSGKVIDISFDIIDYKTGKSDQSILSKSTDRMLYTVYTIEISESYKGSNDKTEKLCIMGGVSEFNVEEQYKLMQESGLATEYSGIPILTEGKKFAIGESYLFCTHRSITGNHDNVINMNQFVFYNDSKSATLIQNQCLIERKKALNQ